LSRKREQMINVPLWSVVVVCLMAGAGLGFGIGTGHGARSMCKVWIQTEVDLGWVEVEEEDDE
jgi:ribosome biogenesis protein Nip4